MSGVEIQYIAVLVRTLICDIPTLLNACIYTDLNEIVNVVKVAVILTSVHINVSTLFFSSSIF